MDVLVCCLLAELVNSLERHEIYKRDSKVVIESHPHPHSQALSATSPQQTHLISNTPTSQWHSATITAQFIFTSTIMKIAIFSTIALWAATLPAVTANFDIYWVHQDLYDTMIWMVFAAPPSCDEVNHTRGWGWKSDVSGNKYGMRCQGNGCGAFKRPEEIDVLEMNFNDNPQYHWSMYLSSCLAGRELTFF